MQNADVAVDFYHRYKVLLDFDPHFNEIYFLSLKIIYKRQKI